MVSSNNVALLCYALWPPGIVCTQRRVKVYIGALALMIWCSQTLWIPSALVYRNITLYFTHFNLCSHLISVYDIRTKFVLIISLTEALLPEVTSCRCIWCKLWSCEIVTLPNIVAQNICRNAFKNLLKFGFCCNDVFLFSEWWRILHPTVRQKIRICVVTLWILNITRM